MLSGSSAANQIHGGTGSDTINGLGGDDLLWGENRGYYNPYPYPPAHADSLYGGDGNDKLCARDNVVDTILDGGAGNDEAQKDSANPSPNDPTTSIETLLA